MGEIIIKSKHRGSGIYQSTDKTWEYHNKLIVGKLTEDLEYLTLHTFDPNLKDQEIQFAKKRFHSNTAEYISYQGRLDYGPLVQLKRFKKNPNEFEYRCTYEKGFVFSIIVETGFEDKFLNDSTFNPNFTRKVHLNGKEIALLYHFLSDDLFVRPIRGYLIANYKNGNGDFYFDENYYNEFTNSIKHKFMEGEFARSNAENDWINFMNKINQSEKVFDLDATKCQVYLVSK